MVRPLECVGLHAADIHRPSMPTKGVIVLLSRGGIVVRAHTYSRDDHQNLKLLLIDLNQMQLIGLVERNILVFISSKSDVPLQSYGF